MLPRALPPLLTPPKVIGYSIAGARAMAVI
jgi:hypothetical protein